MSAVLLFPGQSSRREGMLTTAEALHPDACGPVLDAACEVLGRDLRAWDTLPSERAFATNRAVQVGVFVANHLHLTALYAHGVSADRSAGLSLGEYNHLVHIGAVSFPDALRVVDARGAAYDEGPSGCMAAVFPVSVEELEPVLERVSGFVALANLNSPSQQVIAGEEAAVHEALALLDDELYVDGRIIERRIPMHTARFAPAAVALEPALRAAAWTVPERPYVPNVLGRPLADPDPDSIVDLLVRHVSESVRWKDSVEALVRDLPDAPLVEVGPARVLHDLLQRSWVSNPRAHTAHSEALDAAVEVLRA